MIEELNGLDELPHGWIRTQLGEVAEIILGQSPPSSTYNEDRKGLPFYQGKLEFGKSYPTPRKWCMTPKKIAEKGDVLISVRAPVGPTNICPEKSCIGRGLAAIRGLGGIGTFFILYVLRALESEIARKGTGTTFSAIGGDKLKTLEIPLPPLNEQERIVAKLEELFTRLDAGVEGLRKVKAQLRRYRQAVLKYAFEGKLTEEWRKTHKDQIEPATKLLERIKQERREKLGIKYKELPPVDAEDLPMIPEIWAWARVGSVIEIIDYRGRTPPFSDKGIPHLRSSNIRNGKVIWEDLKYVSEEAYEKYMTRGLPQTGDLLFTTEAPLGEVALVPEVKFSVAQRLMILRPMKNLLDSKFLLYQLMSSRFQARLKRKGTGTTVTGVSSRNFKPVELVIAPWAEQIEIVQEIERRLSLLEEIEKTCSISLKQADRLRGSILKTAFEGKLVPQDPSDEAAEKLLERIREERAKSKGEKDINRRNDKLKQLELSTYVE
jgi:type I restriction enzyme S subunit